MRKAVVIYRLPARKSDKIQRCFGQGHWYEVMTAPATTTQHVQCFPAREQTYDVLRPDKVTIFSFLNWTTNHDFLQRRCLNTTRFGQRDNAFVMFPARKWTINTKVFCYAEWRMERFIKFGQREWKNKEVPASDISNLFFSTWEHRKSWLFGARRKHHMLYLSWERAQKKIVFGIHGCPWIISG